MGEGYKIRKWIDSTGKIRKQNIHCSALPNVKSVKQLLDRSRYLLYKSREKWTQSQKERANDIWSMFWYSLQSKPTTSRNL